MKVAIIYLLIGAALYLVNLRGYIKGFSDNPDKGQLHAYMLFGALLLWPVAVFSGIKALMLRILKKGRTDQDSISSD